MQKYLYVYIVECSDQSYYTGITNNLERRLIEHNRGLNSGCYTYTKRPVKLVFSEYFTDYLQAIAFEKKIKRWSRAKKTALIRGEWDKLKQLSACKNKSNSENYKRDDCAG